MSPKSTSAISPSETTCEKPMPRGTAQSSIAVIIAPDWLRKAISPASAAKWDVEPKARHHDADAVRPDNAQQMGLCRRKDGLLQRPAPLIDLAETGGNDDGRT